MARRVVVSSIPFVLGFTAIFVALGVGASLLGDGLFRDQFLLESAAETVPQTCEHVLVNLTDARFGEVEYHTDLGHGQFFVVVEQQDEAFGWLDRQLAR